MNLIVDDNSIFLGCTVNDKVKSQNRIVVISLNREIEGINFIKEVGWKGEGELMSIVCVNQMLILSGMFKLDKEAVRGGIISMDGATGKQKSNLITK
jgi:hypothetical protein